MLTLKFDMHEIKRQKLSFIQKKKNTNTHVFFNIHINMWFYTYSVAALIPIVQQQKTLTVFKGQQGMT